MAGKKERILNRVLNKGFTLIELLITICVLSVLLIFAAPSFSSLFESSRMKTAQDELMGFVIMAKSEAVFRNAPVYIHFRELANSNSYERCIALSLSDSITDCTTNVIYTLNGRVFDGLTLDQTYPQNLIEIDPVSGWPLLEHSTFDSESNSELLKFFAEGSQKVAFKMHITGRVSFCGVDGDWYRTEAC
ncbi:prepilin-type N-terminal cleavage/methylation domain-containing protein [Vibrio sp. ED002]|uniref:pilus assembly FimT family protein n=1 Tax=Vibrio sp. ED002 TaxID=2785123 RepID=UPI00200F20C0|nr:prepilin-type N-terminal cleavage/methylation domain-containing protein [Vibrio sp. ED002]